MGGGRGTPKEILGVAKTTLKPTGGGFGHPKNLLGGAGRGVALHTQIGLEGWPGHTKNFLGWPKSPLVGLRVVEAMG
jgi:hypothetical protein